MADDDLDWAGSNASQSSDHDEDDDIDGDNDDTSGPYQPSKTPVAQNDDDDDPPPDEDDDNDDDHGNSGGGWKTVIVRAGDSLSLIAQRELGNANRWREIFNANRDQISNPDLIHPGQKLKLPS